MEERLKILQVHYGQAEPGATFEVSAETPRGELFVHERQFETEAGARRLADRVKDAGDLDPCHWHYLRTRYGSEAFEEEEAEACRWADMVRSGNATIDDAPDAIRTML